MTSGPPAPRLRSADGRREFACFPAAILAFVVNDADEVLLLSHPARKGGWEVISGAIEEGESPVEALLREVAEEAGPELVVRPVATVHTSLYRYDNAVPAMISVAYAAAYVRGRVVPGSDMAMSEHRWLGLDDIESRTRTILVPAERWLFRRAVTVCRAFHHEEVDLEPWVSAAPAAPLAGDRVLKAILFTDLVESTRATVAAGDSAWAEVLDRHALLAKAAVDRRGGRVVKEVGDGIVATFDSAAAAVLAARELQGVAGVLGLQARAGVHVGEVHVSAFDIAGQAVVLAARLCAAADADEVLLSRTAADLVVGSQVGAGEARRLPLKGLGEVDAYPATC